MAGSSQTPELEIVTLRARVDELEETLRAIQSGEVDALVVSTVNGDTVFTLENADQPYRLFVENMTDGAVTTTQDGIILYCNAAFSAILHLPLEQIIGHYLAEHSPGQQPDGQLSTEKAQVKIAAALSGEPQSFEWIYLRSDGTPFQAEVMLSRILLKDEYCLQTIVRDITERKQADEALRETTDYLQNLLDYANAPIIVWDPSLRITRFNHAFERLTGRISTEVLGQPLEILFPLQSREPSLELIKKTISGERWETVDIPILHVNGSIRTVLWNSATLLAEDQTTVIATIAQGYDITERKLAEDALVRVNQKLNVITNLTRQDLTIQLFVLKSYLEITKKNAAGQDRILEGIQKCERAILSISEITEFTKDFQDMGAKPPQWQNVKMTLLFGLSHISIGNIQHSLETENLEIFADPLLEKVSQRLFENSVKHGEHVTRIRVWHTVTTDGVTIFFEDDGTGIPQEKKEQIFLRSEGPSASMRSLIFVREILDITGITIRETGSPGKGARFESTVPKGMWRIKETDVKER
ncbi:MAG: PAS domain S-box protein [Methanoregula sp.]|nr:PAS domain S-box protein [Methanoregula sp.]